MAGEKKNYHSFIQKLHQKFINCSGENYHSFPQIELIVEMIHLPSIRPKSWVTSMLSSNMIRTHVNDMKIVINGL